MDTIYPSTPQSPSILLIGGREHVLYHGLFEPLRIADAKLLWLNSAVAWLSILYLVLIAASLGDDGWWSYLAAFAALLAVAAIGSFMKSRSVVTTPVAINEKDRRGTWSRLAISTRRHGTLTATVNTDMADFLLTTLAAGQTRRFTSRPDIPVELTHPGTQRHVWISAVGTAVALLALVAAGAYLFLR